MLVRLDLGSALRKTAEKGSEFFYAHQRIKSKIDLYGVLFVAGLNVILR